MKASMALLTLGLLILSATANSSYERGRHQWESREYPEAYTTLRTFRTEPYGRRLDVDFMLGTSACRIEGRQEWGANVLDWMLYSYPLTHQSRIVITDEREACREFRAVQVIATDLSNIHETRSAGLTAQGKTFYWAGTEEDQPVSSYPIRRIRDIAREELVSRLVPLSDPDRAVAEARQRVPNSKVSVHDRVLLVSIAGHNDSEFDSVGRTLNRFIGFLQNTYSMTPPGHFMTVYLTKTTGDVQALAESLHGLAASRASIGYAFADDASVVGSVQKTAVGTIIHELFHLMIRANFGDVPQWIDEGMASLYEVSGRTNDRYYGLDNWRGQVLKDLWEIRPTVEELVRIPWFSFDDTEQALSEESFSLSTDAKQQAATLAMARYFMLFLESHGQIGPVFTAFRDMELPAVRVNAHDLAVATLETTLNDDLVTIDAKFSDWFQSGAPQNITSGVRPDIYKTISHLTTSRLNIRTGPSTSHKVVLVLKPETPVGVLDINDGWGRILLTDGTEAFLSMQYLRPH